MTAIPPAWTEQQPPFWKKPWLVVGFVFVGLMWHALLVDFIPADWLYSTPFLVFFAVPGVAASAALVYGNHRMGRLRGRKGIGIVFAALLFAPLFALMSWLVAAKSVGALVTATVGERHTQVMEGDVVHRWRRRKCDFFVQSPSHSGPLPRTYCVSEDFFQRYGDLRVRVRLAGDRSVMGTRLTGIEHVTVLGSAATGAQ